MNVPFSPISLKKSKKILGNKFYWIAQPFASSKMDLELKQAGFDLNSKDYLSLTFFSSFFMATMTGVTFFLITLSFIGPVKAIAAGGGIGLFFAFVTIFYQKTYPKLLIKKKVFNIERNILYALRHMYVQVTSGVPLYDAIVSISQGNYGQISTEFNSAVRAVNTGVPLDKAIDDLTVLNPSLYFRRAMWQISNGVKTGSDIGYILKNTIDYISAEQKIMIRKYGSQLNPMTVAYMMIAVIMPSLGITFLMVVSSFAKLPIGEETFWMIIIGITIFQFMFMGMLKSKRPNLL
jgi:flagellar protein FlaJ